MLAKEVLRETYERHFWFRKWRSHFRYQWPMGKVGPSKGILKVMPIPDTDRGNESESRKLRFGVTPSGGRMPEPPEGQTRCAGARLPFQTGFKAQSCGLSR